jgi:hypothetical protein
MMPISQIYTEDTIEAERVLALDQPEYSPLIALRIASKTQPMHGEFTRWEFSEEERNMIALGANLVVSNLVLPNQPFPPICLQIVAPGQAPSLEHLI